MNKIETKICNDFMKAYEPDEVTGSAPYVMCSTSQTTICKPYWIIQKELEDEINKVIDTPVETEYCEKGTVSRFLGKIIGYNISYEDVISYKNIQEHTLHYDRGEILMYESCLFNLPNDNSYENIRSILKKIRKQIGLDTYKYY